MKLAYLDVTLIIFRINKIKLFNSQRSIALSSATVHFIIVRYDETNIALELGGAFLG